MDSEQSDSRVKICAVCSQLAEKCCSTCRNVDYCCVEHQKADWKSHKLACKAIEVEVDKKFGRHYVAKTDLKPGTFILKETPLVSAPRASFDKEEKVFCCMGCYNFVVPADDPDGKCSKCKWPVCSETCEKASTHSENECKHFAENEIGVDSYNGYDISVLKTCLLKSQNPKVWEAIQSLRSEPVKPLTPCDVSVRQGMLNNYGISDISAEELLKVSKILALHSIETTMFADADQSDCKQIYGRYFGLQSCMFVNSCSPNCEVRTSTTPQIQILVRTTVDIKKGEILTISRNTDLLLRGTFPRRQITPSICNCRRCMDPSELESNISTWICQKCQKPSLVATDPLDDSADWQCGECNAVELSKCSQLTELHTTVLKTTGTIEDFQQLIQNYCTSMFHENHWILIDVKVKILVAIAQDRVEKNNMSLHKDLIISTCKFLLKIFDKISPGVTLQRAQFQYRVATSMMEKVVDDIDWGRTSRSMQISDLGEIIGLFLEARKYFEVEKMESEDRIDGPATRDINENLTMTVRLLEQLSTMPIFQIHLKY